MHRVTGLIFMVALSWLLSGCGPKISPQEAKVLVALDEIQRGVEADIDYEKYLQLLATTKAEIDMLKPSDPTNPCFLSAVEKACASYEIAGKAWKRKMTEEDEKKKADMDMTLSFSLSFSSINIEKANKCYE